MRPCALFSMLVTPVLLLFVVACNGPSIPHVKYSDDQVLNLVEDYAGGYCDNFATRTSLIELSIGIKDDAGFGDLLKKIGISVSPEIKARFQSTINAFSPRKIDSEACNADAVAVILRLMGPLHPQLHEVKDLAARRYSEKILSVVGGLGKHDVADTLIVVIPRTPGKIKCSDFVNMIKKASKHDILKVVRVAAPYLRESTPDCYEGVSLLASKHDRGEVLETLLANEFNSSQ